MWHCLAIILVFLDMMTFCLSSGLKLARVMMTRTAWTIRLSVARYGRLHVEPHGLTAVVPHLTSVAYAP